MSDAQVSIYLPPLKTMKSVVDRMKNLSNYLVSLCEWEKRGIDVKRASVEGCDVCFRCWRLI